MKDLKKATSNPAKNEQLSSNKKAIIKAPK